MKVGLLRWWWLQIRRVVLIPTSATLERAPGSCVKLTMALADEVPLVDVHAPLSASFDDVRFGGSVIGTAILYDVRDGWGYYRCSIPLKGRFASGDWRRRHHGPIMELAAIALLDETPAALNLAVHR